MSDLEELREEMVIAFREWAKSLDNTARRTELWWSYTAKRERFLRADCELNGRKYLPLLSTVIAEH